MWVHVHVCLLTPMPLVISIVRISGKVLVPSGGLTVRQYVVQLRFYYNNSLLCSFMVCPWLLVCCFQLINRLIEYKLYQSSLSKKLSLIQINQFNHCYFVGYYTLKCSRFSFIWNIAQVQHSLENIIRKKEFTLIITTIIIHF